MESRPPSSSPPSSVPSEGPNGVPKAPVREVPPALRPLQFMGIPKSVLTWKPRLPSRNWSIFLVTSSTLTYLWWDDRRQCKKLMEEYKEKVRWMSEQKMQPHEWPRKVVVYGTKSPGDEDYDESILFFKKYMKPVLAAAGLDWEILNGTRHGGLARDLTMRIHKRRRQLAGYEPWSASPMLAADGSGASPFSLQHAQLLQRELDGGIVLMGRPAMKEWFWALKSGWTTHISAQARDPDEELAEVLSKDHAFDEVPVGDKDNTAAGLSSDKVGGAADDWTVPSLPGYSGVTPRLVQGKNSTIIAPPAQIPAQPPLCFVDFVDLCGWRNWPRKIVGFWRRREKVRQGGDAALRLIYGTKESAREFEVPEHAEEERSPPQGGDLDWGIASEDLYAPFVFKTPADLRKARENFYKALPEQLMATRQIARGEREPTKQEARDPPPSESDLRVDRFSKEKEWRGMQMGFDIIKPDAPVSWDRSFRSSIRVFSENLDQGPQPAGNDRSTSDNL